MEHAMHIVCQIERVRESRGMPISELARRSLIDAEQMRRVIRQERVLKAEELVRLCLVLNLPFERLVTDGVLKEIKAANRPRKNSLQPGSANQYDK